MSQNQTVSNTEQLDRILQGEWLIDGKLQASAFALRHDETYLSVNSLLYRPFRMMLWISSHVILSSEA